MQGLFEVASGSVIGRHHQLTGKNNQDAYCSLSLDTAIIAVVCDGCGSSPNSEVGAKVGAQLMVKVIQENWEKQVSCFSLSRTEASQNNSNFWQNVQQDLENQLQSVIHAVTTSSSLSQVIQDYFLFTIVGVLIEPFTTSIFTVGDGCFAINNEMKQIQSPENAPAYLAYNFLETLPNTVLQVQASLPTSELKSLLIGTDGVGKLIEAEAKAIPGKEENVGAIAQFWQEDRYFKNPDMIRRRLALINRNVTTFNQETKQLTKQVGLLPDDTTLLVIRRRS